MGRGSIGGRSSLVKRGLSTGLGFHWGNPLKQWSHLGVLGGNEAEVTVCIWEKQLQQAEAALTPPLQVGRGLQIVLSSPP